MTTWRMFWVTAKWRAGALAVGAGLAATMAAGCGMGEVDGAGAAARTTAVAGALTATPATTTVTQVTISGVEQFDDYRDYGRFAIRKDALGANGRHHAKDMNSTNSNYLALYDATVEIREVDKNFDPAESDCRQSELVGSTTVAANGSWSVTLPSVTDTCASDDEGAGQVSLAVKILLRYCDDVRCFSVVDPRTGTTNSTMTVWHQFRSDASLSNPWLFSSGQVVSLGTHYFEDTSWPVHDADERNDVAMIFSGLVDITRKFHVQNSWPFHVADDGEVFLQFPSTDDTGNTHGTSTIEMLSGQLKNGWTPLHEYGHILEHRVTSFSSGGGGGGDYSMHPCGTNRVTGAELVSEEECKSWDRTGQKEYQARAWLEGFADFAAHVTLDGQTTIEVDDPYRIGCSSSAYDGNATAAGPVLGGQADGFGRKVLFGCDTTPGTCFQGSYYPTNVARGMCDWFDDVQDVDSERPGNGDLWSHTLDQIYTTMNGAYTALGATTFASDGFTMCDFVKHHINVEGADVTLHKDIIQTNGYDCGF